MVPPRKVGVVQLTVGFDLDLTLADTRAGIAALWDKLAAESGVQIDTTEVARRIGSTLEDEMGRHFPADQVPEMIRLYRAYYPDVVPPVTTPMPGAAQAIDAVRRAGGSVLVISAKQETATRNHVESLGLDVDDVIGGAWAEQKGLLLVDRAGPSAASILVYVGDHPGDVRAAKAAGALSVAVATGGTSAEQLRTAGADLVLADLTEFGAELESYVLSRRLADLEQRLAGLDSVMVAFSGGADSAFVLAAAVRALGPSRVVAATAMSPSLPASELEPARAFAESLGVRHYTPETHEMEREGYRANAGSRCYFCKSELLDVLRPVAAELGIAAIATGTNADDARAGFRPGIRAADERGAVTPLRDSGFTKSDVRRASRQWDLATSDKPAAACLSSRVAYGISITPARLARVERAEAALRTVLAGSEVPVRNLRVRDLGDDARIEVDREHATTVAELPAAIDAVRDAGFAVVEVDPKGFRSGAMNELLADPERYR